LLPVHWRNLAHLSSSYPPLHIILFRYGILFAFEIDSYKRILKRRSESMKYEESQGNLDIKDKRFWLAIALFIGFLAYLLLEAPR
jgi:hypothetical protein